MSPFLHPLIRDGKVARFGLRAAWSLFFGRRGFAFPFHSVQYCSLQALPAIYASKQVKSWITERQLNVTGLKTATGGKHPSAITSMTEGLDSGFRGKIRTRTLPDCHYVLCFFFTLNVSNCCYFCLLQLPPTLSPNPQRRIVEQFKRALFSPQNSYFVNLKSEVKKVSLFFPSKCFATLGLQKGYSLITDWMATTYLYFSICAFQDQVVTNFWFHNITA